MIVYFDGQTHHAAMLGDQIGKTLCGFPPMRPDGTRWSMTEEIPPLAQTIYPTKDEPVPLVDCEYCHEVFNAQMRGIDAG